MEKVESKDGTKIAYETLGSGPPLVLVGGAFCDRRARAAGLPLARVLAGAFTVHCLDRRGRGDSGDTPPYAVAREVEDVAALLSVTGGPTFAYGHSSGALLLLEGALAGLQFEKLALYEPPLVLPPHREAVPEDMGDQLVALTTAGKRSEATELFLTRAIGMPTPYVQQMKAGPAWRSLEAISHTLSYDAAITRDPRSILARAPAVQTRTLLLDGTKSQPWMRAAVAALAEAMPNTEYRGLPEQTHDVMPEALAPHLERFFIG